MPLKIDDLIAAFGEDPRTVTLERVQELVLAEARSYAGRAMAAVKLGKGEILVTLVEASAAFRNPETKGDPDLTAKTIRTGENALLRVLVERGFYDPRFANLRIDANHDLDEGEVSVISQPAPPSKRKSGRPSRSRDHAKMLATDVHFRLGAGEASSVDKIVEHLTGRDRYGDPVSGISPVVVLPNGKKSHRTITGMLHSVARDAPALLAEARRQGELVKAGGAAEPEFYSRLMQYRAILAAPAAVKSMLRAVRRKN